MKKGKLLFMIAVGMLILLISGTQAEAEETPDKQVTAVVVPQNLNFYLDPENNYGNGQIYSNKYEVRNAGSEPVVFSMEISLSVLEEETPIAFCQEKWEDEPEDRSVYMYVVFESSQGEEQYILTDASNSCGEKIVLQPAGQDGDSLSISFGGMLSISEDWKSGELAVNAIYKMAVDNAEYPVEISGEHIRIEEKIQTDVNTIEISIVPDEGYFLPEEIKVTMDGSEIEASYDANTGKVVLENVTGKVVVYANGITMAVLPDAEVMNAEEKIWSWTAEEGIQAYEYTFLREDEVVKNGRIDVEQSAVEWDWSEGLEDGSYKLRLKAIGDAVHCLDSEEAEYSIIVNRELLEDSESAEGEDESSLEEKNGDSSKLTGKEDASLSENKKNDDDSSKPGENEDESKPGDQESDDDLSNPGDQGNEGGSSKPGDKENEGGSSKPGDKENEGGSLKPDGDGDATNPGDQGDEGSSLKPEGDGDASNPGDQGNEGSSSKPEGDGDASNPDDQGNNDNSSNSGNQENEGGSSKPEGDGDASNPDDQGNDGDSSRPEDQESEGDSSKPDGDGDASNPGEQGNDDD